MKLIQKEPNSVWFTKDIIKCSECNKKKNQLYDILDKGMYCVNCLRENFFYIFGENQFISVRLIISEQVKKEKIKRVRQEMNLQLRFKIIKRDNFKCVACGDSDRLEVDHIIPVSKGGDNYEKNLQTLCFRCNRGKFIN